MAIKKSSPEKRNDTDKNLSSKVARVKSKLEVLAAHADNYWLQQTPKALVTVEVPINHQESDDSDWHLGNPATNVHAIQAKLDNILSRPHMRANQLDDPIDGTKGMGASTSHSASIDQPALLTAGKQFVVYKDILSMLETSGQLTSVSDATGEHAGWAQNFGVDLYDFLPERIRAKVLANGGVLRRKYPNGQIEESLQYHDAGPGGSDQNPFDDMRNRLAENNGKATIVMSGHHHGRWGWAQDTDQNGKVVGTYIATGTQKGVEEDRRDTFMQNRVFASRGGGVITTHLDRDGVRVVIPSLKQSQADMVWEGSRLLELAEQHHLTDELKGQMAHQLKDEEPRFTFERYGPEDSRIKEDHFGTATAGRTKHWTRVVYETDAKLPLQIMPANNLGAGNSTSDMETFEADILNRVKEDPHVLVVYLRQLLAKDVPGNPERVQIVEGLLEKLGIAPGLFLNEEKGKMSVPFVLFDNVLRDDKWKASVGPTDTDEEEEKYDSYMAASEIEDRLGVPMLDTGGEMVIKTQAGNYSFSVHDRLQHSGAIDRPQNGLRRVEMRHIRMNGDPHDVVMGGHMPVASVAVVGGVKKIGEQGYVSPGHYSEWTVLGKGNSMIPSRGGQAVTIIPQGEEKQIVLTPNANQSEDVFNMLTLREGARQTGGVEKWEEKLGKRKGKRVFPISKR